MGRRPKPEPILCRHCGGGSAQHMASEEGCWCPRCLAKPVSERCQRYEPAERKPVEEAKSSRSGIAFPLIGTDRRKAYDLINRKGGLAESEICEAMGWAPLVTAAVRMLLVREGLLHDSRKSRPGPSGAPETVWVVAQVPSR